jgi:hypothetical protein
MSRPVVTATVTIPARSLARSISVTFTPDPSAVPPTPAQQAVAKANPSPQVIRYAAAVLKGQPDTLEFVASCFISNNARIKKHEEGWILESSEFASCYDGEQIFLIADDIVSRVHRIVALYGSATPTFSVEHIYWINAQGEPLRSIRGSIPVNMFSSKGLAELKSISGAQPLGSAVFQAMILDSEVNEALTLHGAGELNWSQVYDIIEFFGETRIVKDGYAHRREIRAVRQTANHYRHLGRPKKNALPSNPPTLAAASEVVRNLLRRWISSRL